MAAITFLTGQTPPTPEPVRLASQPRLSIADGLRLLRTPSSEAGVLAYHRTLEDAPPAPSALLAELAALREGRSTRLELLTEIAVSPKARARGVGGPGLLMIRLVRKAFIVSGAAARVRSARALASQAQTAAQAAATVPSTPSEVARKLVVLEGALLRLENRVFAEARASQSLPAIAALESRIAALEAEVRTRILDEARSDPRIA